MTDALKDIHKALIGFSKRAEKSTDDALVATFVDSEPLFDLLSTSNAQIVYGRRGTGKTHALKYLAETVDGQTQSAIYLDLRTIGSNGSIYADSSRPLGERASNLLSDVVSAIQSELEAVAIDQIDTHPNPSRLTTLVDDLRNSITTMKIVGEISRAHETGSEKATAASGGLSLNPVTWGASIGGAKSSKINESGKFVRSGEETLHLDFGGIASATKALVDALQIERLWLLLDEWSEVPYDLQPYLADLLRRTVITLQKVTIKIGAIEHRSVFSISKPRGEYIGLEVGADIFADLNLDNFLVFDNDQEKATHFFKTLIFAHYKSVAPDTSISSSDEFISAIFTQWSAFEEFVRAVEGVPRDALNLASSAATKVFGEKISVNHVRLAARDWYQQDKSAITRSTPELSILLAYIVDEVIGVRRARAFLYSSNSKHELIERLFDNRLLHVLKRNISSHDAPGERFDVYKIDYGCYVDLINTTKAPEGLFIANDDEVVEVPKDDYRSIRRAILRDEDLAPALGV